MIITLKEAKERDMDINMRAMQITADDAIGIIKEEQFSSTWFPIYTINGDNICHMVRVNMETGIAVTHESAMLNEVKLADLDR